MISGTALIFRLNRKIDRLNTENKKAMKIVDMCNALTESQYFLVKKMVRDMEKDKELRHMLAPLEVKEALIPVTTSGKVSKIKFPDHLYRDGDIRIVAVKRGCGKKEITLTKIETGDKGKSLTNPYWKSSYGWEQVFGDEGGDYLYVYNGTDFKVEGMIIDYIRKPDDIHVPSLVIAPEVYMDWNGEIQTVDTGWLIEDLSGEGINMAAALLTRDIGDPNDFQLQVASNNQTDQIK